MTKINERAKEYLDLFERQDREDKPYTFYIFKSEVMKEDSAKCPLYERISGIMHKLEVSFDFAYYSTVKALEFLVENEDCKDTISEAIDDLVFIYTNQLTAWLSENINHISFCDEALEESGAKDTITLIMQGMFKAYEFTFYSIINMIQQDIKER